MAIKNPVSATGVALLFSLATTMILALSPSAHGASKLTMEQIIAGAKKEGTISWATNLTPQQVKTLNAEFQKEYPFVKEVKYARMRSGEESERVIAEMQTGMFPYDMFHIEEEHADRYKKLGLLIDPVAWKGLFNVDERMIHPDGFGVSVGNDTWGILYNTRNVPKDHVPKKWSDCYDPYFKGKLSVDVRPAGMISVWEGYGEKWTLDFAKKLKANNPRWIRGNTQATLMVAAGEILISCPGSRGAWYRQWVRKKNLPVGFVFPEGPIVGSVSLLLTPMKGAGSPYTAILLTGWIAGKGVTYLDTGRESIFHPGTKLGKELKDANREIKVESWESLNTKAARQQQLVELWGFPKPSK